MKWLLLIILTSLLCQYSIGQEFPIDCKISKSLAKDDFIKGERYWSTYDSIESNNRLIIQAFENYIKIKYSIIIEPHPAPIRFTDDASFINIIDNEEEGQIFLRDDCYYLELKRLILEKVASDFIEVGKQYILNRIDSIIEARTNFYFKLIEVDSSFLFENFDLLQPKIPVYIFDTLNINCPEIMESLSGLYKEYFEIFVNRYGKIDKVSVVRNSKHCWTTEICKIILKSDQTMKIATIKGTPVNYKYYIPIKLEIER